MHSSQHLQGCCGKPPSTHMMQVSDGPLFAKGCCCGLPVNLSVVAQFGWYSVYNYIFCQSGCSKRCFTHFHKICVLDKWTHPHANTTFHENWSVSFDCHPGLKSDPHLESTFGQKNIPKPHARFHPNPFTISWVNWVESTVFCYSSSRSAGAYPSCIHVFMHRVRGMNTL